MKECLDPMGYLMVRPRVRDDEEAGLPEGMPGSHGLPDGQTSGLR
jgi:hypothetical protein